MILLFHSTHSAFRILRWTSTNWSHFHCTISVCHVLILASFVRHIFEAHANLRSQSEARWKS